MRAMRNVLLLVVVAGVLGFVVWLVLGEGGDEVPRSTAVVPTAKVPNPFAKRRTVAPPAAPAKPLPPLTLSPERIPPNRHNAAKRPIRDPYANSSVALKRLPQALVDRKKLEASDQPVEEEGPKASLDKEDIQDAIKHAQAPIVDCYDQALKLDPKLAGRMKVEFTIVTRDGVGRLDDASIIDDEEEGAINKPFLAMCALKALADLEFPPPKGEGKVTVRYPFNLRNDKAQDAEDP